MEAGALNRHSFNSSAPSWRQSGHGLNIEGRCTRRTCAAYKHRVIAVKVSALLAAEMLILRMLLLLPASTCSAGCTIRNYSARMHIVIVVKLARSLILGMQSHSAASAAACMAITGCHKHRF